LKEKEVSVVTKMYDFAKWLLPLLAQFPRAHRFTLGDRIEDGVLEVLDLLVEASYTRDKRELLRRANVRLERVRYLMRLAKDLECLKVKTYLHAAEQINAVGKEIGGWEKQQRTSAKPPH
jgi:hypothetical protein